ncbi:MAG TPA: glycosyltransferase family 39 protein [Solirubrobacteraceae bacterium]|nr:glycosyltransferase family 39 protein [Solirubrobacteraceae bacterium]
MVVLNAAIGQIARPVAALRAVAAGPSRGMLREQGLVAGAQLAAGVGNLAFALVAARLLAPGPFAELVAFLALYLLIHVPASSLSAGSALSPTLAARTRRRALVWGLGGGALLAGAALPLANVAGVSVGLLLVLATVVPLAPWLALERGRLYGAERHGRVAASLAIEPLLRLALGLPLAAALGAVGGAVGVVLGGWAALAVARSVRSSGPPAGAAARSVPATGTAQRTYAGLATAAFLVLAILQNQDVVLANSLLEPGEAGRFAVLSTLGGLAAFATTTVPLVLLPRAAGGERGALAAALAIAVALGGGAVAAVALVPSGLVGLAFGDRYAAVGALAVPYVGAMALFGVARVLVAHRCAQGGGRRLVAVVGTIAVGQALALVLTADDAGSVATITLCTMLALAGTTALPELLRLRTRSPAPHDVPASGVPQAGSTGDALGPHPDPGPGRDPAERPRIDHRAIARIPDWVAVAVLLVIAAVVRLACTRGIWLDEATSISQAQMPVGHMLEVLRSTDVHPPLYFLILWCIAHAAGTSAIAMRAPSLVAGTALVPVLYLLGRELYDRRAGMLAAALGSVAPFVVWYSQEARMYALFMLFAALATYAQVLILRRGGKRYWLLYAAAAAALLWTQYFGVLFVGVQQVGFLAAAYGLRRSGRPARRFVLAWLGTAALIVVAVAPIVPFALDQFQANQSAGKGFNAPTNAGGGVSAGAQPAPGIYALLTNFVWGVGGYHSDATMAELAALWPLGMLAGLLALGRDRQPLSRLILACAVLPALALFAIGFAKPFLFEIRYFAGAVPLLLVLLARGATGWVRGTAATIGLSAALLGTLSVADADQQLNRSNPRTYDFPGALSQIKRRWHPGDVLLYQPDDLGDVITYYAPDLRMGPLSAGVPQRRDAGRVFLLGSFLTDKGNVRATRAGLARLRRTWRPLGSVRAQQIRVWEFGK